MSKINDVRIAIQTEARKWNTQDILNATELARAAVEACENYCDGSNPGPYCDEACIYQCKNMSLTRESETNG